MLKQRNFIRLPHSCKNWQLHILRSEVFFFLLSIFPCRSLLFMQQICNRFYFERLCMSLMSVLLLLFVHQDIWKLQVIFWSDTSGTFYDWEAKSVYCHFGRLRAFRKTTRNSILLFLFLIFWGLLFVQVVLQPSSLIKLGLHCQGNRCNRCGKDQTTYNFKAGCLKKICW